MHHHPVVTVVGLGYVGLSLAVLIGERHPVHAVDINYVKINQLKQRISPVEDLDIARFLREKPLTLSPTLDLVASLSDSEIVIIATPTNFDPQTNSFDTTSVEGVIAAVAKHQPSALVVIKSTVPLGFTARMQKQYPALTLIFSPEFLRETQALADNLNPSRIVIGFDQANPLAQNQADLFAHLLQEAALNPAVPILMTTSTEAEAIKLFANTYLALRVAFFNELDSYAETNDLRAQKIIAGVALDPRIGDFYNNPSFGYGGYCLPKDTKQLLANYASIPQVLIEATVESNRLRKLFIAEQILARLQQDQKPLTTQIVGVYRLRMKAKADNFRDSSIADVIKLLDKAGVKMLIYEPVLPTAQRYLGHPVTHDLADFKAKAILIIANRYDEALADVKAKLYTRDLYNRD